MTVLPPVDDEFGEVGGLVDVLADADDGLLAGAAEVVDFAACVGAGLVQLGLGSCWTLGGSAKPELELLLALGDGDAVAVGLPLGLTLGLTLGLGLGLTLGLTLGLGLGLGLAEALGLGLELGVPLLGLGLGDVAAAVGLLLLVAAAGELALVAARDALVDGDVQGLGVVRPTTPGAVGRVSAEADGTGPLLWPSVLPALLEEELLLLKAELIALPTDTIAWRAGGTTDRTTPMANTATPTAKAGRSMASRQSRRCRSRRGGSPCCGACRTWPRRPTRPAAKPEMASQTPRAP